jgi:hypothetical protein
MDTLHITNFLPDTAGGSLPVLVLDIPVFRNVPALVCSFKV